MFPGPDNALSRAYYSAETPSPGASPGTTKGLGSGSAIRTCSTGDKLAEGEEVELSIGGAERMSITIERNKCGSCGSVGVPRLTQPRRL